MKNNWIKIFGHATKSVDGIVFEQILKDTKGVLNVVELGTFYGRHAVLWNEIAQENNRKLIYTTIDEDGYAGSHMARESAKESLTIYAPTVRAKTVNSFVNEAKNHEDSSIDVLTVDICFKAETIADILKSWHSKVSLGGYITWHLANSSIIGMPIYTDAMKQLYSNGFCFMSATNHIISIRKIKEVVKEKHSKNETAKSGVLS